MWRFLVLLLALSPFSTFGQDCYQVQFDHMGFDHVFDASFEEKACSIRTQIVNETGVADFPILSYNVYRLLAYIDEADGFDQVRSQIEADLSNRPYFLAITKEMRKGGSEIEYGVRIKLPQSYLATHRLVQVEAYESILKEYADEAFKNGGTAISIELGLMERFANFLGGVTMSREDYEAAGYTVVPLAAGSALRSSVNASNSGHQYATIEVKNPNTESWIDVATEVPSSISLLSYPFSIQLVTSSTILDDARQDAATQASNVKQVGGVSFTLLHNHNISDAIFLKMVVHEDDAEFIAEKQFEQTLASYGIPIYSLKQGVAQQNRQIAGALSIARNHIMKDLKQENFAGGIGCGLLDGLLGTIEAIWSLGKGVVKGTGSFFGAVWEGIKSAASYTVEVIEVAIKEGVGKAYLKMGKDAYEEIKKIGEFIDLVRKTLNVENLMQAYRAAQRMIEDWFDGLMEGDKESGYMVGELVFDVVFTFMTAGAGSAAKGASFMQKITDFFQKHKSINRVIEELKGTLFAAGEKVETAKKVFRCKILGKGCFVKDTPVWVASGNKRSPVKSLALAAAIPLVTVPIQEVQLFDYVLAHETVNEQYSLHTSKDNKIEKEVNGDLYTSQEQKERDVYDLNDTDWFNVHFEQVGGTSKCQFALHDDWINKKGYKINEVVLLDIPEQSINGPFRITGIKHIIPQKKPVEDPEAGYAYRPVTALFYHEANDIHQIAFDSGDTLGVTYKHPIFSATHNDWRLAGELEKGEAVLTKKGLAKVLGTSMQVGKESVYNLEVSGLHNFLVGESGVVVHNSCIKVVAKNSDITDLENSLLTSGRSKLEANKSLKEVGDAGITKANQKGGKLTKSELFALWAKARRFESEHALITVKSLYSNTGQRITMKVTKTLPNGKVVSKEIVPDFLVKDGNQFRIIDAKFTTKADTDFTIKSSLTKNQKEVFEWMKNGDNISIEITANQSKLNDLGLLKGDKISISGVDILKSKTNNLLESEMLNYY